MFSKTKFIWQRKIDNDCADQMVEIGGHMSEAPYKAMLGITDDDANYWQAGAAQYRWLQKTALTNFDAFKQALTGTRDLLTFGPGTSFYTLPMLPTFVAPVVPAGLELRNDYFDWANVFVKQWKAIPAFNVDLQRQMGLVVPVESELVRVPEVKSLLALSGGLVKVDVYRGSATMAIVQLNVDNAGWPEVEIGGALQKTLAGSHFEFQLVPGYSHSVQVRSAFANRAGVMLSDWSAVKVMSSLA